MNMEMTLRRSATWWNDMESCADFCTTEFERWFSVPSVFGQKCVLDVRSTSPKKKGFKKIIIIEPLDGLRCYVIQIGRTHVNLPFSWSASRAVSRLLVEHGFPSDCTTGNMRWIAWVKVTPCE